MTSNQVITPMKKIFQNKKTFIVSSLMTSRSNILITKTNTNRIRVNSILNTIDREFSQPSEYLNIHSPIQVGKKPQMNPCDKPNNPISFSYLGAFGLSKAFRRESKNQSQMSYNRKSLSSSINNSIHLPSEKNKPKQQYDIIDEKGIRKLFSDIKNQTESNKLKSRVDLNELPNAIKEGLNAQEKTLGLNQLESNNITKLSKYLSRRTNQNEKELLINNLDAYRLKRQVIETIASNIPDYIKYGVNNWSISLRRPENFSGVRETFINVGTEKRPFWTKIFERNPKENSCSWKPRLDSNVVLKSLKNIPNSHNRYLSEASINKIDRLNNLAVNGKNLLQFEYENVTGIPGKKIVYKKSHIDSLSLPKNLYGSEFSKSYENILSEQVICANYKKYQSNMNTVSSVNMTSLS